MDYGSILTDSKWKIIKEIAQKEQTPTDLANKTHTSLANITQQLKLLEAYGFVKKERQEIINKPGKPKTIYSLQKELLHILMVREGYAEKKDMDLDFIQKGILNLWVFAKKEDVYPLEKYFAMHEDLLNKCQAVFIVKSNHEQIDLLTITEHIDEIREKYSNKESNDIEGKKKNMVSWTHTLEEVRQGLLNKEEYFINLTKNMKPIIDKENIIKKIQVFLSEKD